MTQELGGNFFINPSLLHHFIPLDEPKNCKSRGAFYFLTSHPYIILPTLWQSIEAQKDVRDLS